MKCRQGCVSNSSSTGFVFCFTGDHMEDLFDKIRKYKSHFSLSYLPWDFEDSSIVYDIDAEKVISSIKANITDDRIVHIDKAIKEIKAIIKEEERYLKDSDKDTHYSSTAWLQEYQNKLDVILQAKQKNIASVIEIDFGDNHGDIKGGEIGTAMDYEGRNIQVDENDFIIITEQHR